MDILFIFLRRGIAGKTNSWKLPLETIPSTIPSMASFRQTNGTLSGCGTDVGSEPRALAAVLRTWRCVLTVL